jgi:hypothetical protein
LICLFSLALRIISFLSMTSLPNLARLIKSDPRIGSLIETATNITYNDSRVRLREQLELASNNESQYFSKINTWHPTKVGIISNAWNLCTENYGSNLDLFVYLWTKPSSFKLRRIIRKTWANRTLFPNMNVAFILGLTQNSSVDSQVTNECQRYGDIILGDFIDAYRNLSFKSLIAWRWVKYNCMNASYFLKMDVSSSLNSYH